MTEALVWWSISLPFQGVSLLFSRTFFSLQQPWATTALAGANLVVNALVALALYEPFGIAGHRDRHGGRHAGDDDRPGLAPARARWAASRARRRWRPPSQMLAAAALLAAAAYGAWYGLDEALGRSLARPDRVAWAGRSRAGVAVYAGGGLGAAACRRRARSARLLRRRA